MTPGKLMALAEQRKCVVDCRGIRQPAAFVVSMQFYGVMRSLPKLKQYKPKAKTKSPWQKKTDEFHATHTMSPQGRWILK
jgi:hypothetical protein